MTGPPPTASARAYLRDQLPAVFRSTQVTTGADLLGALETVLDPVVAILDNLPAYLDADVAPGHVLDLLASWLGADDACAPAGADRRAAVRTAAELGARRGTREGLERALAVAFPSLPLTVEDAGAVRWRLEDLGRPAPPPAFTVVCDTPLDEARERLLADFITRAAPAGVRARLRVRQLRRDGGAPR